MFGFLKEKLKAVVSTFTKKVEEESPEETIEVKKLAKSETAKPQEAYKPSIKESAPKKSEPKGHKEEEKKHKLKKEHKHSKKKSHLIKEQEVLEEENEEILEQDVIEEQEIPDRLEEELIEEKSSEEIQPETPKKGFFSRLFGKKEHDEFEDFAQPPASSTIAESEDARSKGEQKKEAEDEKPAKGFFSFITEKITTKKISEEQFNELFWDLELVLLESNVAVEVIEKIKEGLKSKLVNQPLKKSDINNIILASLKESIESLFNTPKFNLLEKIKSKKPCVICFIGVNGSGKTTTIAKVAHLLQKNKLSCVMAAADTFRAAAIQQLEEHANNLNIKLIKHDYGSDPAAVAFDAIKHAEARHLDAVLIDTAGRLHSNEDLMKEMQKIIRVAKPDLKLFIGESITGNDCVEQARKFNEAVGIDGIILAKADVDDKGGAAISVSYITGKPILYLGVGQGYGDLKEFDKEDVIRSLGL